MKILPTTIACAAILPLVLTSISGCSNDPPSDSVSVGQSKNAVRKILGDPQTVETSIKRNEVIWGPEEEFWDDIPEGSELEKWSYEQSAGRLNLYFVDGSDRLGYKVFAFVFASSLAGVGGGLYVHYLQFSHPDMFNFFVSVDMFLMVVLGGAGTLYGPLLGVVVLQMLTARRNVWGDHFDNPWAVMVRAQPPGP